MRIAPPQPKVTWKTLAVTSKDALAFARELERSLQEITDEGFQLVSQQVRGDSVILTGQKVDMSCDVVSAAMRGLSEQHDHHPPPVRSPVTGRRRIIDTPSEGVTRKEVLYYYFEDKQQKHAVYPDLLAALRVVKGHLDDTRILPISLVVTSATRFELKELPALLRTFKADLALPKPTE